MKKYLLFLLVVFSTHQNLSAQTKLDQNYFVSPGLSIGYTFGAGINYGFVLDAGLINNNYENSFKYGLSFSYYLVSTRLTPTAKRHVHQLRSTSIMIQNNFFDAKLGIGHARNKWGYGGNRNRCIIHGIAADISFCYPNSYSPWIGFKTFRYNQPEWAWFRKPYNSLYIKYKYDLIPDLNKTFVIEK